MILIVGTSTICKRLFDTPFYIRALAEQQGFTTALELVDTIRTHGLMTRRNETGNIITCESVLVFRN